MRTLYCPSQHEHVEAGEWGGRDWVTAAAAAATAFCNYCSCDVTGAESADRKQQRPHPGPAAPTAAQWRLRERKFRRELGRPGEPSRSGVDAGDEPRDRAAKAEEVNAISVRVIGSY